jgi:hypothetical protein
MKMNYNITFEKKRYIFQECHIYKLCNDKRMFLFKLSWRCSSFVVEQNDVTLFEYSKKTLFPFSNLT